MREINIDLSSDNYSQQPIVFGGFAGEHNESVLNVRLPERMINITCSGYRFDFQTSENNKISSPLIPVANLSAGILSFHLSEQLTTAGKMLFNIAAIQATEDDVSLIAKTNTVILYIKESPEGDNVLIDPKGYKDEILEMVDDRVSKIAVDQEFSPTSSFAQSGKAISGELTKYVTASNLNTALDKKVDKIEGKSLSANDYTTDEKTKLAGIEAQANKTVTDQVYNKDSTNPQSGKAISKHLAETLCDKADKTEVANVITNTQTEASNQIELNGASPFKHYIEVQLGNKNLINIPTKILTNPGYIFYKREVIGIEQGTYTFSFTGNLTSTQGWWLNFYDADGGTIGGSGNKYNSNIATITLSEAPKTMSMYVNAGSAATPCTIEQMQLERGVSSTEYTPVTTDFTGASISAVLENGDEYVFSTNSSGYVKISNEYPASEDEGLIFKVVKIKNNGNIGSAITVSYNADTKSYIDKNLNGDSGTGTSNYNALTNRPQIGGKTLTGNHDLNYYGLDSFTSQVLQDAKDYTDNEIATFDFIKVVDELPATGLPNRIYFVPKTDTQTQDLFDEYAWIITSDAPDGRWEWITTKQVEVDLTNYATKSELPTNVSDLTNDSGYLTASDLPISDEQWQEVSQDALASGFSYTGIVGSIGAIKYKRVGGIVFIKGNVKGTIDTSQYLEIFMLPEGYRPETRMDFICAAQSASNQGNRLCEISIFDTGAVSLGAVVGQSYGDNNWFSVDVSFTI